MGEKGEGIGGKGEGTGNGVPPVHPLIEPLCQCGVTLACFGIKATFLFV